MAENIVRLLFKICILALFVAALVLLVRGNIQQGSLDAILAIVGGTYEEVARTRKAS